MDILENGMIRSILILLIVLVALRVERLGPAEQQPPKSARFNLLYIPAFVITQALSMATVYVAITTLIGRLGGGWITLPAHGWGLVFGFIAYAAGLDFMEYAFHRAQHRFPVLWAMHSFHHSDTAMNASTTSRHFWGESAIKAVAIYLPAGLLFKANPIVLGLYALLGFYNVFPHMNLRIGFGRWWFLMNSPQYHRIHHSSSREHHNRNFAALFPVYDVIFRSGRMPAEDEYPPTGIENGDRPVGVADTFLWPVRRQARQLLKTVAHQVSNK